MYGIFGYKGPIPTPRGYSAGRVYTPARSRPSCLALLALLILQLDGSHSYIGKTEQIDVWTRWNAEYGLIRAIMADKSRASGHHRFEGRIARCSMSGYFPILLAVNVACMRRGSSGGETHSYSSTDDEYER